jgi:hypothetical protein
MGNTFRLTNSIHLQCVSLTASALTGTEYTVLTATSSSDRRIYAFGMSSTDANTQTMKIFLNNGTTSYPAAIWTTGQIAANLGNSTTAAPLDILGLSRSAALFEKRLDVTGVPYFNLPKNWSIRAIYSGTQLTTTEALTFTSYGEAYDGTAHRFTSAAFEQAATYANAGGTTETDLISSAAYDRRIYSISAVNTDVTARVISIRLKKDGISYLLYTVNIPANSGATTALKSIDIFRDDASLSDPFFSKTYEPDQGFYFNLPAGWALTGTLTSAPAIGSTIVIKSSGDQYE